MAVYTVHMPRAIDGPLTAERARFIREGFSWAAFFFGPFWLLRHRLWLATVLWLVAAGVLAIVMALAYLPVSAVLAMAFAAEIFVGLEANNINRNRLPKRGFRLVDVAAGRNRDEVEQRFFARWTLADAEPAGQRSPPGDTAAATRSSVSFPIPAAEMVVALIDYGSGNLHSAQKAFERAARMADGQPNIVTTSDPDVVRRADRIVLPGVGAFADCRRGLDAIDGMVEALEESVIEAGKPFLGICVGMQLMATRGLEYETTAGLGWIAGDVKAIVPNDASLKIPHMGWNTLDVAIDHPLLADIPTGERGLHAYFVHSYQFETVADNVLAQTVYGAPLTAIVGRDNMVGTQFHPEKSQKLGLALISNFLRWKP